jgi:hypothetical protein
VADPREIVAAINARHSSVTFRHADRGNGDVSEPWTEVSADLPKHYPLRMRIERGRVKPGQPVIDIELGTPVFDEFFIVEAAPADVVRQWIDEKARQFLMAQPGLIELTAWTGQVQFATIGSIYDSAKALELADFVAGLAARLREAYAAADRALPAAETGSPYREEGGAPTVDIQARRQQEIDQVHMVSNLRSDRESRRNGLIALAFILLIVLTGFVIGMLSS